jgi:hypothetical protein
MRLVSTLQKEKGTAEHAGITSKHDEAGKHIAKGEGPNMQVSW